MVKYIIGGIEKESSDGVVQVDGTDEPSTNAALADSRAGCEAICYSDTSFDLYLVFFIQFINKVVFFSFHSIIKQRVHVIVQVFGVKVFFKVKTLKN